MRGFKNPSGDLPFAILKSFRRDTMPAKVGLAQEVPATELVPPLITTWKPLAWAATSGNPRPVVLNKPAFLVPTVARNAGMAVAW